MNSFPQIDLALAIRTFALLVVLALLSGLFFHLFHGRVQSAICWLRDRIEGRNPWIQKEAVFKVNKASKSTTENSSTMPDSLKNLRVEDLGEWGAFILHGFHADLTIVQGVLFDDPKLIARACKLQNQFVVGVEPRPPVRLHSDNVLFYKGSPFEVVTSKDHESLSKWLMRFDWSPDRSFCFQRSATAKPVEDGFVRCVRIIVVGENQSASEDARLHWTASEPLPGSLFDTFSKFMHDEYERVKRSFGCEQFLLDWYKAIPQEEKTHPGFAILQQFDDGTTWIEFAGSVISPTELRFWSRVACYHK